MKRTLLAVGTAVLLSMMYVPYGQHGTVYGHEPFWQASNIMVTPLILQTVFASVAAAMVVNIRLPTKYSLETLRRSGLGRRLLFLGWLLFVAAGIITAFVLSDARGVLALLLTIVLAGVMVYIHTRKDHRDAD
jgi:ABC-type xylose transport system permease subunit